METPGAARTALVLSGGAGPIFSGAKTAALSLDARHRPSNITRQRDIPVWSQTTAGDDDVRARVVDRERLPLPSGGQTAQDGIDLEVSSSQHQHGRAGSGDD